MQKIAPKVAFAPHPQILRQARVLSESARFQPKSPKSGEFPVNYGINSQIPDLPQVAKIAVQIPIRGPRKKGVTFDRN